MAGADADALKEKMLARGIKEEDIAKYDLAEWIGGFESEEANVLDVVDKINLAEWIGGFESEEANVLDVVDKIKNHPLIPDVPVHGLIIDIVTGELKVLKEDY